MELFSVLQDNRQVKMNRDIPNLKEPELYNINKDINIQ
tara:strand:+ start:2850 stop:2963 length:114 start_codon:yes stop_codon:yes gene_type:complete